MEPQTDGQPPTQEVDSEEEAQFEGERYLWSCPKCGNMNEEEHDIRGSKVDCRDCNWEGKVSAS